jgi:hypothetical protein
MAVVSALALSFGLLAGAGAAASAAPPAGQGGVNARAVQSYLVLVRTADIPDAGTDATIRIKVYGTLNESPGYVNLDNAADNFEQNQNDIFGPFSWFDIGVPDFIGVFKDSNGSEWYAEWADIYSYATGRWYHCPMDAYYPDGATTMWFDCP